MCRRLLHPACADPGQRLPAHYCRGTAVLKPRHTSQTLNHHICFRRLNPPPPPGGGGGVKLCNMDLHGEENPRGLRRWREICRLLLARDAMLSLDARGVVWTLV